MGFYSKHILPMIWTRSDEKRALGPLVLLIFGTFKPTIQQCLHRRSRNAGK